MEFPNFESTHFHLSNYRQINEFETHSGFQFSN